MTWTNGNSVSINWHIYIDLKSTTLWRDSKGPHPFYCWMRWLRCHARHPLAQNWPTISLKRTSPDRQRRLRHTPVVLPSKSCVRKRPYSPINCPNQGNSSNNKACSPSLKLSRTSTSLPIGFVHIFFPGPCLTCNDEVVQVNEFVFYRVEFSWHSAKFSNANKWNNLKSIEIVSNFFVCRHVCAKEQTNKANLRLHPCQYASYKRVHMPYIFGG